MGELTVKEIGDVLVWLVGVAGALAALYKWVVKPIQDIRNDTGDLIGDRLCQAHDYWMRKGYCPRADKTRLCHLHKRYRDLKRNHLVASYEEDLINLPDEPPKERGKDNED